MRSFLMVCLCAVCLAGCGDEKPKAAGTEEAAPTKDATASEAPKPDTTDKKE